MGSQIAYYVKSESGPNTFTPVNIRKVKNGRELARLAHRLPIADNDSDYDPSVNSLTRPSADNQSQSRQQSQRKAKHGKANVNTFRQEDSLSSSYYQARYLFRWSHQYMHNRFLELKEGRDVDWSDLSKLIDRIYPQLQQNKDIFLSICLQKQPTDYVAMRSISFSALMMVFAMNLGYKEQQVREIGLGSLVHDAGKMWVPDYLFNKQGGLTREERRQVEQHVQFGQQMFDLNNATAEFTRQVIMEHHERFDGSGYPKALQGEEISTAGKMAAIVDVYDALTSQRGYNKVIEPTEALAYLLKNSDALFCPELVQKFIRCVGIYPAGSFVKLKNDRVAIVLRQGKNLLRPLVRIVYDLRSRKLIAPVQINLAQRKENVASGISGYVAMRLQQIYPYLLVSRQAG